MPHRLVIAYENTLSAHLQPGAAVCIALSGGMDSSSLLHAALQNRQRWKISACHVNHGISQRAHRWQAFCRDLCASCDIPLTVICQKPPDNENGSEEWARAVRLQAFSELQADAIIAAHHADDQAETVLFRLLRGSGVHGIAAMDTRATPAGVKILRPWLNIHRDSIMDYALSNRLRWVEDEDNHNLSRRRNFLRWRGLPTLKQGFYDCNTMLAAAGRRMREGSQLLLQLARQDEEAARRSDGGLEIAYFRSIGELRTRNWLYRSLVLNRQRFSERLIAEVVRQIINGKGLDNTAFRFKERALHCWRGALYWQSQIPPPASDFALPIPAAAGRIRIDALGGYLILEKQRGIGLSPIKIGAGLQARLRRGGERLTPAGRCTRTASNLLQEAGIPPWRRQLLPFLYAHDQLAEIAGVAVASRFAAEANEEGLVCRYVFDDDRDCQ